MRSITTALTGVLASGTLLLVGCSGAPTTASPDSTSDGLRSTSLARGANEADIAFAQGMIPHHRQAIEMAKMAEGRAADPRILDLAGRIKDAQTPELATLTEWLADWDAPQPDGGDPGHDMGGSVAESDMEMLADASGMAFDRAFIDFMLAHHTDAVGVAETEIEAGRNPSAIAMARKIRSTQSAEIQEMERLRDEFAR